MNHQLSPLLGILLLGACAQTEASEGNTSNTTLQLPPARAVVAEKTGAADRFVVGTKIHVSVAMAEERLAPSDSSQLINRVYKNQVVTVYDTSGDWVRVNAVKYSPRWIKASSLAPGITGDIPTEAETFEIPSEYRDSRIAKAAIPEQPGGGLSEKDILILWKGAKQMLDTGRCSSIDYADKSTSRAGTYFVQEGNRNLYFTESDLK